MNLDKFNLNLFVALDAVLHAGSLTEAARTLHLTQPALSIALKKLRETYGDEIVIYGTGAPVLTPLGEALRPRVKALIQNAKDAMKVCPTFNPATARHDFHLAAPDILELIYLPAVFADALGAAPGVRLSTQPFGCDAVASVLQRGTDLAVVSEGFADPQFSSEPLYDETIKCLVWTGNDRVGQQLTPQQYFEMGHAAMTYNDAAMAPDANHGALQRIGQECRTVLQASSHAVLPHLVVGTQLIATTLARYAHWCAQRLPVRVLPFPFEVAPLRFVAQWQPYRDSDPALLWLRDRLQDGARRMRRFEGQPGRPVAVDCMAA